MGAARLYLAVYNWVLFAGWTQILYSAMKALYLTGYPSVYDAVEKPLQIWQTAALMELVHGILGVTRSPVTVMIPQIGSRIYVTWGVLFSFPQVRNHWIVTSLILSWSITEVIRYSFFGMKETFGSTPRFHLWLRYSTFLMLYPTGISSEVGIIYLALPYMRVSDLYCIRMPNKLNFGFDYFTVSVMSLLSYLPGSPGMYTHMLSQRKKVLSAKPKSA